VRLRGRASADPLNLIRVIPAQGDLPISYRRIPVDRKEDARLNAFRETRVLTEAALAVALAFVLGFVVLFKMPFGGSVSLEMIPLILLALRQGWKVGIVAGAAYGLLDLAIDPYLVHPVQVILDYPLAFGALGLAGLFRPTVRGAILGATVAVLARFVCHLLSGVVFFASYAPEGWNPFLYSAAYNAAYLVPSLAIAIVVTVVLLKALEGAQPSARQVRYRGSTTS
jgi:thiamine transporter